MASRMLSRNGLFLEIIVRHDLAGSGTAPPPEPVSCCGSLSRSNSSKPARLLLASLTCWAVSSAALPTPATPAAASDAAETVVPVRKKPAAQCNRTRLPPRWPAPSAPGSGPGSAGLQRSALRRSGFERGAERCRRQQRLPHVIGHVTQTGTDHIEYQCPGRNASQAVQEGL